MSSIPCILFPLASNYAAKLSLVEVQISHNLVLIRPLKDPS
jgi:hypothetical protein